jgi:hypothetical protein
MKNFVQRLLISGGVAILCLGISQIIPNDMVFGMESGTQSPGTEEAKKTEDEGSSDDLSVHLTVDSSKVNPMVRHRYQIFVKPDPKNPQSQKTLFALTKENETTGEVTFKGVKEAKQLQVFVVKDNYQRDCTPEDTNLKEKMTKDSTSTIGEMPHSISIKLTQTEAQLKETDEKKFSGYDAVPTCKIMDIDDEGGETEHQ